MLGKLTILSIIVALLFFTTFCFSLTKKEVVKKERVQSVYDFTITTIDQKKIDLTTFKGSVLLLVNTASRCGFTYQYEGLESLHQQYKDKGLVIIGFPANNFMAQEPGSNTDILNFCKKNYGVSFLLSEKISVKGKNISPLYNYLTSKKANHEFGGKISWNFNKFIIDKDGQVIARFGSSTKPSSKKLIKVLEKSL